MKPICVACQRFFKPKTSGFYFLEGMPASNSVPPGKEHSEQWRPYKLWAGDLYECESCGAQTIVGVGFQPIAEHYQEGFGEAVARFGAKFQVNDC